MMIKVHFFFDLMNLDILVPHREHLPANLLLPFFMCTFFTLVILLFFLHLTQ